MSKKTSVLILIASVVVLVSVAFYFLYKQDVSASTNSATYQKNIDLNSDGVINEADYLLFSACWHQYNIDGTLTGCRKSDIRYDLAIDGYDFSYFAYYWRVAGNTVNVDFDKDNKITDLDYAIFRDCWSTYNKTKSIAGACTSADTDKNGAINALDASMFSTFWRYSGSRRVGDMDGNKTVDSGDYSIFKSCWKTYNTGGSIPKDCRKSDINSDGQINALDFTSFTLSWRTYASLLQKTVSGSDLPNLSEKK